MNPFSKRKVLEVYAFQRNHIYDVELMRYI